MMWDVVSSDAIIHDLQMNTMRVNTLLSWGITSRKVGLLYLGKACSDRILQPIFVFLHACFRVQFQRPETFAVILGSLLCACVHTGMFGYRGESAQSHCLWEINPFSNMEIADSDN